MLTVRRIRQRTRQTEAASAKLRRMKKLTEYKVLVFDNACFNFGKYQVLTTRICLGKIVFFVLYESGLKKMPNGLSQLCLKVDRPIVLSLKLLLRE
jgi:hypothetical protein